MKKLEVLRRFEEPTDILVLGAGFGWKIGLNESKDYEDFLIKTKEYERGITDDYIGIDIDEKWIETQGYVTVYTLEEIEFLKEKGLFEEYMEGMLYENFVGEITIGVINDETKQYMQLPSEMKDYYILYDLENEEDYDWDRTVKIEAVGSYSRREDYMFEPDDE